MYKELGRKSTAIVTSVMLLMGLVCNQLGTNTVHAESDGNPTFEVETVEARVGESFTVDVNVRNNPGMAATGLEITYDKAVMGLTNIEYNSEVGGIWTLPQGFQQGTEYSPLGGSIIVAWMNTTNYTVEDYTFITLTFVAKDKIGTQEIGVSYGDGNVGNESFENLEFDTVNGSVDIYDTIDSLSLDGTVATPTKLVGDTSSLTGTNVSAEVSWSPALVGNEFAAGTAYTATITVTGNTGYVLADDLDIDYSDYEFTKQEDSNSFVATKTFEATAEKEATKIEVTTVPKTTTYTDGDTLNTEGMVVTTTYDDGTTETCTDYTVSYTTGDALVKGDTTATVTSGSRTATVTGLTVNGKTATIGLFQYDAPSLTYSGVDQADEVTDKITVEGTDESRGVATYSFNKDGEAVTTVNDAGTYEVYASLAGGTEYDAMNATKIGEVTIAQKSIIASDFTIDVTDKVYTASQIAPSVTSDLILNTDYTVTYGENINADDDGRITVTAKGNYTGTISDEFDITPIVLKSSDLEYTDTITTKIYDGTTASNITRVSVKSGVLESDKENFTSVDGTAVYNSKDVATATSVIFTPTAITSGNYIIAATEKLTITGAEITAAEVTDTTTSTSEQNRLNVVKGDGSFAVPRFTGVGEETVTGTLTYTYDGVSGMTYDDVKAKLKDLAEGTAANVEYTFTGSGNYGGEVVSGTIYVKVVDIQFEVDGATATIANAVTVHEDKLVYGYTYADIISIGSNIQATVNGMEDNGTGTYRLNEGGFPDAGDQAYSVTYTGTINGMKYVNVVVCSGELTVQPKELTVDDLECTINSVTKVYDGTTTGTDVEVHVKEESLVAGNTGNVIEALDASVVYNSADVSDAETAIITTTEGVAEGNYRLVSDLEVKTVTASIKPLTVAVTIADVDSVDYNGEKQEPMLSVSSETNNDFGESDYTVKYSNNKDAGTATATVSDVANNNYDFPDTVKTFIINKVAYSGTTTAATEEKYGNAGTYDLSELELPEGAVFGEISTTNEDILVGDVTVIGTTLSYEFADKGNNVGKTATVTIPVTSTNYNKFDITVTLKVLDKTAQSDFRFTAEALTKAYGDASFDLAIADNKTTPVTYESNNEEVISLVNGVATIHKEGTATITAKVPENSEYKLATATQTITVAPKQLTVSDLEYTGTAISKVYDGDADGDDVTVSIKKSALVGTDTLSELEATVVYNSADVSTADEATLTTTEDITTGNYRIESGLALTTGATITPKTVSVTLAPLENMPYTGSALEPSITVTNTPDVNFTTSDYNVAYDKNVNVGTATVTVSDVENNNYVFTAVTVDFDITKIDYNGTVVGTDVTKYGNTGSYDLTKLGLPSGYEFGALVVNDTNHVLTSEGVTLEDTVLSYEFENVSGNVGKKVMVTIPVTCDNYKNFNIKIDLEVTAKLVQEDFAFTQAKLAKVYGDDKFVLVTEGAEADNGVAYSSDDSSIVSVDKDGVATIHKAGTVTLTATAKEDKTYVAAEATQTIEISKRDVVVEVASEKVLVGDKMPMFETSMSSLAYGDKVLTEATLETTAKDTLTAGTYDIHASGLVLENVENYNITYKPATLTIVPEYKVTLDANGGTIKITSLKTNVNQHIIGLVDPVGMNNTYVFEGWFTGLADGTKMTETSVVEADITLYAHWSLRASADSGLVTDDVKKEIVAYDKVVEFTEEQTADVNKLALEVVYDINKEEAKANVETVETLLELDTLFVKANPNLNSIYRVPSVPQTVTEDDKLPNKPVVMQGLALSAYAGKEIVQDTNVYLNVRQMDSLESGAVVVDITPHTEENGKVRVIDNSELQTPVVFKLYVNDSVASKFIDVLHILHDGGEETFRRPVQEDVEGKYIIITVTQFSEFHLSEVIEAMGDSTSDDTSVGKTVVGTGDNTNVLLVIVILVISLMGMAFILRKRRTNK